MQILQTTTFKKTVKKLHKDQKIVLDMAVEEIINNPSIGTLKKGDLSTVYVYKFHINKQLMLLAYTYTVGKITLLALGTHENFYRDMKK